MYKENPTLKCEVRMLDSDLLDYEKKLDISALKDILLILPSLK